MTFFNFQFFQETRKKSSYENLHFLLKQISNHTILPPKADAHVAFS